MLAPSSSKSAFAPDGWIHIVPKGELLNQEGGVVQVLDDAGLRSILAAIEADKARLGDRWPGLYAGREHHIYDASQSSEALAWFKEFDLRPDGLWASAEGLTDIGREAVESRRFKFTSFVVNKADLQPLGGNRFRVLRVDTIGFTNQANGKELLTPITNRASEPLAGQPASEVAHLTARQAGSQFSAEVARVQNLNGWTHDQAWNHTRQTHAALYNRMAASPDPAPTAPAANDAEQAAVVFNAKVGRLQRHCGYAFNRALQYVERMDPELLIQMGEQRLTNREARHAADRLLALAQNRAKEYGCSFDSAWRAECAALPDLYTRAGGKLFNREDVESSADFKRANAKAGKAFAWLREFRERKAHPDRGEMIQDSLALRGAFLSALDNLMTDPETIIAKRGDVSPEGREWIESFYRGLRVCRTFFRAKIAAG